MKSASASDTACGSVAQHAGSDRVPLGMVGIFEFILVSLAEADFEPRDRPDYYINCYRRIPFGCVGAGAWLQKAQLLLTR